MRNKHTTSHKKYTWLLVVVMALVLGNGGCDMAFEDPYGGYYHLTAKINGQEKSFNARAKRIRKERNISLSISVVEFYSEDGLVIFVENYTDTDNYINAPDSAVFSHGDAIFNYSTYNQQNEIVNYSSIDGNLLVLYDNNEFIEGEFSFVAVPDSIGKADAMPDTVRVTDGVFQISFEEGF